MATTLPLAFGITTVAEAATNKRAAVVARAAKSSGGAASKEKGLLDWILGGLQKEDQLLETDPILKKVEEGQGNLTSRGQGSMAMPPPKKNNGGFAGFFAKK